MKVLFVGGTFDESGGKPSSIVNKFVSALGFDSISVFNGGDYSNLHTILDMATQYDAVFWWADVPNTLEKVRNVKEINPHTLLITSKNNTGDRYEFPSLINRALGSKSNLVVEFKKLDTGLYNMMLFDPLGAVWYDGTDITKCASNLKQRLLFLSTITRTPTYHLDSIKVIDIPDETEFFDYVKNVAEVFHQVIPHDETVNRFLGNSSFRCQRGFPSFRCGDFIFVSQRNIDKRFIDKNSFVKTFLKDDSVFYYGDRKPSVDSPIQLRLYDKLPNVNYMVHAHCYVKNAPFTSVPIPCGGVEEVDEIMKVIGDDVHKNYYAINLIGHGCTIMSNDVNGLKNAEFISRDAPEYMKLN